MDSSSPNNKTIDTKEEKWKLLLGEACHDMLAGSVLRLNLAAARLGLSTPRQPTGKARLASPFLSCLLARLPPSPFHLSSPCSAWSMHSIYAAHSPQGGRNENKMSRRDRGQHGDGLRKERLQKSHSRLRLKMSSRWAPLQ